MSALLNKAGKKLFASHLEQYAPVDPMYETYVDSKGKNKRRKRELPPGLSARDTKILKSVKRRAHYLDKGFNLCGLRFGWTFIIGIIPGAGDIADATLNYVLVVRKARQAELPTWLLNRMLLNNAVSAIVGLVPFAGDVVLAMYKANSRNAALLEEFLRIRGEEYLKAGLTAQQIADLERGRKSDAKGKGKETVRGVNVKDSQIVKPGAGRETGEVVPGESFKGTKGLRSPFGSRKQRNYGTIKDTDRPQVVPKASVGRFVEGVDQT